MDLKVDVGGILAGNDTYDYSDYQFNDECSSGRSEAVLIPLLYSVVLVVGLLGNVLLLVILALKRRCWSVTDTFVLYLSAADILLLVTLPFWAAQAAQDCGWSSGTFLCKISGGVFHVNFYCGIFLLVCITLDRYRSAVHSAPMYQTNPRFAHITCLMVWLLSLLLTIPDWIFLVLKNEAPWKTECAHNYYLFSSRPHGLLASRLVFHVVGFLLPSAVLIYSCVRLGLRYSSQNLRQQGALRVIFTLALVFFFCWLPYNITLIVDTFTSYSAAPPKSYSESRSATRTGLLVTTALGCVHACLRPVIYLSLCRNFRERALAVLRCVGRPQVECDGWLWELGVEEQSVPAQAQEKVSLKQTSDVQSSPC